MINYFWLEIKGKNPKRLLTKIFKEKINIENIKYEKDRILLKVSYEDYQKIKSLKTTYEINIVKTGGKKHLLETIKKYKISLLIFIISIFFVIILSKLTLFINIDTDSNELKKLIKEELTSNNVNLYSFKKDYDQLTEIKNQIKNNNLDKIEWLELSQKGVILNVKVIERVTNKNSNSNDYKDIVAEKNGYIRKIDSRQGELRKNIDDYVKKGEVIISGNIFRNEKPVAKVKASGKVYAEVWYIIKANENVIYNKAKEKSKGRFKLVLNILNHEIKLLNIPKQIENNSQKILFKNNSFVLYLKNEKEYVLEKTKYTENEISKILETKAKKAVLETLEEDEYIIEQKTLKKYSKNGRMYIEVFFSTYENIGVERDIQKIVENKETEE